MRNEEFEVAGCVEAETTGLRERGLEPPRDRGIGVEVGDDAASGLARVVVL